MILVSPLPWHFCFFWILLLPSPSGICDQNHLELAELPAKSFCRGGELAAFSWTVQERRNSNYSCTIVKFSGFFSLWSSILKRGKKTIFSPKKTARNLLGLFTHLSNTGSFKEYKRQRSLYSVSPGTEVPGLEIQTSAKPLASATGEQPRPAAPSVLKGAKPRPPARANQSAARIGASSPVVPQSHSIGWVEEAVENRAQTQKSCPKRPARTAGTCLSVSVAGGKREVAMSSWQRGSPKPGRAGAEVGGGWRGGANSVSSETACSVCAPWRTTQSIGRN